MTDSPHADRAHAALGASNSSIWLNCTGSVPLSVGGSRTGTVYTREGTAAHELSELWLHQVMRGLTPAFPASLTVEGHEIEVTPEMIEYVGVYVETARTLIDEGIWHGIEVRVDLSELWAPAPCPETLFGTADCIAVTTYGTLFVCDLKYGKGKMVSPEDNTQLLYYALGAYYALPPEMRARVYDVQMIIVQPRSRGEKIKTWEISLADLLMWADTVLKPTVNDIAAGRTRLASGNHCFFCIAAKQCPELHRAKVQRAVDSFPAL